ncbi:MAG: thiolase family protein [Salinarimonadaceae bacterium]|nr:MAG: thiolase family protein [Salinarimonadaceae bacterium]
MDPPVNLRDRTAIIGAGSSAFTRTAERSNILLAADAFQAALADAGLRREDVDGVVNVLGRASGIDLDELVAGLGIESRFSTQTWTHSRLMSTAIQHACLAVAAGIADVVAVFVVAGYLKPEGTANRQHEAFRGRGGPHGEAPHYGILTTMGGAALATRRYRELYGLTDEQQGMLSVTLRRHASLNPAATMRKPITLDDYRASPFLVDPLRLYDVGPNTEGACCILVTRAGRAADAPGKPVYVSGFQGMAMGPSEFVFSRPGLGALHQPAGPFEAERDQIAYRMAGVTPADIDGLYTFDAFTTLILFALERFGFCAAGEAGAFVAEGGIALGGRLPVNTNGGIHSEAHVSGANCVVEMVRQLRGECGERQIADARILQWGDCFGDALILRN